MLAVQGNVQNMSSNNLDGNLVSHKGKERLIIQACFLHYPFGISVWQLESQAGAGLNFHCLRFEDASSEQIQGGHKVCLGGLVHA